ncbi:MAG: YwqG family protein, partial [Defluviitaleaceae bacterium]|nr:YwqG family protein [Defluviitaleaceae bacterium]
MEHLTALLEEFRATTKRQAIRLIAQRSDCTTATNSKFGGLPYLPKDFAYPTNAKGEPLKLL